MRFICSPILWKLIELERLLCRRVLLRNDRRLLFRGVSGMNTMSIVQETFAQEQSHNRGCGANTPENKSHVKGCFCKLARKIACNYGHDTGDDIEQSNGRSCDFFRRRIGNQSDKKNLGTFPAVLPQKRTPIIPMVTLVAKMKNRSQITKAIKGKYNMRGSIDAIGPTPHGKTA